MLQMQTSWPWFHLTNHKATLSLQEERVYAESFLIRNKSYKTKVKFSDFPLNASERLSEQALIFSLEGRPM